VISFDEWFDRHGEKIEDKIEIVLGEYGVSEHTTRDAINEALTCAYEDYISEDGDAKYEQMKDERMGL